MFMYMSISPGTCTMFIRSPHAGSSGENSAAPQKQPILLVLLKRLEKQCVDMEGIQMDTEFPVDAGEWRTKLGAALKELAALYKIVSPHGNISSSAT